MKYAFLFPGQGAQYPGMGKDFAQKYSIARETYEEADELLGRFLSKTIFEGPQEELTKTKNSQPGIYVTSIAILRVIQELFPEKVPAITAGLSLGEYSALTAANHLDFQEGLQLVQKRADLMNEACENTNGTMAVILGLSGQDVEEMVKHLNMPQDLWVANLNCPGQVVVSGTEKGIEAVTPKAKEAGAKRVLPLQVHGAFHSGLMQSAELALTPHIQDTAFVESSIPVVMNVDGLLTTSIPTIKENLIKQVTGSVRWEQGIRQIEQEGVTQYIEIGCGKTLAGFNKRIQAGETISIEKIEDLERL